MRIGVFGGSFDPVHLGHLRLAVACRDQAGLDEVRWVPAARAPHKQQGQPASGEDRAAMLAAALADQPGMVVSRIELDRGGLSYTVDTLAAIAGEQASAELFLLMGADTLLDMPNWYQPQRILELASPLYVVRPGADEPDVDALAGLVSPERLAALRNCRIELPGMEVSSSEVRRRLSAAEPVNELLPEAVQQYIRARGLYQ